MLRAVTLGPERSSIRGARVRRHLEVEVRVIELEPPRIIGLPGGRQRRAVTARVLAVLQRERKQQVSRGAGYDEWRTDLLLCLQVFVLVVVNGQVERDGGTELGTPTQFIRPEFLRIEIFRPVDLHEKWHRKAGNAYRNRQ